MQELSAWPYNSKTNGCNFATDVRLGSKEQVESLEVNLVVEGAENLETEGGCAKEASEEFKKQEQLI